jgi:protein-tyrosine kinase
VSRIHDALKKAEEQRLASLGFGADPAPEQRPELYSTGASAEVERTAAAPMPVLAQTAVLPVDDQLLYRCAQRQWYPTKDALFLSTNDANSPGLEEFRSLRSKLFQMRTKTPLKTLLISSALPGEGKSFVSTNLAQAFARQRGGRTLLIDGDLRKPRVHDILGAPSLPGLYEYLSGAATEAEIIQKSDHDELYFIPAGRVNSTAAELIGNGRMKLLLDKLAPLFNWVIVDSSPVIPVSDATRLAELCDGVLMVLRAGSTPQNLAERAKKEFHHARLLGVVLNYVAKRENPYYKYSYSSGSEKA